MATDAKSTGSAKVDAVVQNVKAVAEPQQLSGLALYSRFALAGAVCCSVTHGGLTPVDVYVVLSHLCNAAWFFDVVVSHETPLFIREAELRKKTRFAAGHQGMTG